MEHIDKRMTIIQGFIREVHNMMIDTTAGEIEAQAVPVVTVTTKREHTAPYGMHLWPLNIGKTGTQKDWLLFPEIGSQL